MPSSSRPTTRWWYDLPDLADAPPGPALSPPLLAEEREHGVTRDVAWAYAEAMPALLGPDPRVDLWPLAFRRGAMRAVALKRPVELAGLYHVQTSSPEVCRVMGARVPNFSVRGEACVQALLRHGSAVREVLVGHCVPFPVDAPFLLRFADVGRDGLASRWYASFIADRFMPIVRLDLSVWLCWDRDHARPCLVKGHDTVLEGRWGPRDVVPDPDPPPWAEPAAQTLGGDGWAATMLDNFRRSSSSAVVNGARGWCRLHTDSEGQYHDALRTAWLTDAPLQAVTGRDAHGTLASVRFDGELARYTWLGWERVLRLRRGRLEQLTTDHDLRDAALRGDPRYPPELLDRLDDLPDVVVRALPGHLPDEGCCRLDPGDRFVLIDKHSQRTLEREAGGPEALARRLHSGPPRAVARWAREILVHTGDEQPVVIIDAGAVISTHPPTPHG